MTLLISGVVGLLTGLFFVLISLFSKNEDYLLDDYLVEDAPDNVRVIERDVPRIIEKEVIVEKLITKIDTEEVERLSNELDKAKTSFTDMEVKLRDKELEMELIENNISDIDKLREEKNTIEIKLNDLEKDVKKYESLFEKTKKELTNTIDDRDHFHRIIERKDVDIKRLKSDINNSSIKHPYIYEGTDEYGKFFDVYSDTTKIDRKKLMKIREINENLELDKFAYYVTIDSNNYEKVQIGDISEVSSFVDKVKDRETNGKYEVFIIFSNRVYPFKLH